MKRMDVKTERRGDEREQLWIIFTPNRKKPESPPAEQAALPGVSKERRFPREQFMKSIRVFK